MEDINDHDDVCGDASTIRTRLSKQDKVEAVVETLKQLRWSFEELVEAWVGIDGADFCLPRMRRYYRQKDRRAAFSRSLQVLKSHDICQEESIASRCALELDTLVSKSPFSKYELSMNLDQLDFAQAVKTIEDTAPTWHGILQQLLGNTHQKQPSYSSFGRWEAVHRRMFTITSMVCFSRTRKNSNILSSCLDVYLLGSGVHRRVIETLHGLGLCHSYHNANDLMSKVAKHAAVSSSLELQNGSAAITNS
jgi:hypothetical protein